MFVRFYIEEVVRSFKVNIGRNLQKINFSVSYNAVLSVSVPTHFFLAYLYPFWNIFPLLMDIVKKHEIYEFSRLNVIQNLHWRLILSWPKFC